MTLEQRLRSMLRQRAEGVRTSQDAWDRIVERTGPGRSPGPRRPRPAATLLAVAAALAVVVGAVALLGPGTGRDVVVTNPTTSVPGTTTPAPTTATTVPGPRCSASDLSPDVPPQADLPKVVADRRRAIVEAAVACDYDRLADLASSGTGSFNFSFGAESDPATFWRDGERRGDRPLWYLAKVLALPQAFQPGPSFAAAQDTYLWPAAAVGIDQDWSALRAAGLYTPEELDSMRQSGSYLGYRAGITSEGDWIFFVAGD